MPTGTLKIQISDLAHNPLNATVDIDLHPDTAGGDDMEVALPMGDTIDATITGITCLGGIGTRYRVLASTPHPRSWH